ncbi:hypothetical protein K4902_31690 [Streptomyces lateritius]|nr:hypothetical protein [Streptomyces lateritius]
MLKQEADPGLQGTNIERPKVIYNEATQVLKLWAGGSRETPAMFKGHGVYLLLTSGATGCAPNRQKYATATSITGTWSGLKDIGDATTYRGQAAYVLPVTGTNGTSYLYGGREPLAGALRRVRGTPVAAGHAGPRPRPAASRARCQAGGPKSWAEPWARLK